MIKAIDTVYDGHRFRSRLEARWAVFFNELGVRYLYEPQGVAGPNGWYLPDFVIYIEPKPVLLEIKPWKLGSSTWDFDSRWGDAVKHFGMNMFIAYGAPGETTEYGAGYNLSPVLHRLPDGVYDTSYGVCICPGCGAVGIAHEMRSDRIHGDKCSPHQEYKHDLHHRVEAATAAARQARFEHGQTPAVVR